MHYNKNEVNIMKISFQQLCNYFSSKITNLYFNKNINQEFKDIKFITKNQNLFSEEILYVGKTSTLIESTRTLENISLLLINDNNFEISDFFINDLNIIEMSINEDIFEIFNQARDLFSKELDVLNSSAALLNSIIKGNGIDNIVKAAAEILDNPIIIIDASYKILAYSDASKITDPYWKENIKRSYCSYDFIVAVKKMKSIQQGLKTHHPFEIVCNGSPIKKMLYKIEIDNKHVGNVIVLECNKPFTQRDEELIVLISKVIAKEMKKENIYRNANDLVYENLLLDLLDKKIKDQNTVKERIQDAGIRLDKKFVIIVFDISKYNSKGKYSGYLSDSIQSLFTVKGSVYYNDYIVMLYNIDYEFSIEDLFNKNIEDFLNKNHILIGVSNEFYNIMECHKYFEQGVKAIKFNHILNLNNRISFYNKIQLYDLISLTSSKINFKEYFHPIVLKLKEYDKSNNSNLFDTLFVYLKNNQNIQKSAKELFIHRNTVRYKINKIIELTKINLLDHEETFHILLSYKLMDYIEKSKDIQ